MWFWFRICSARGMLAGAWSGWVVNGDFTPSFFGGVGRCMVERKKEKKHHLERFCALGNSGARPASL